MKVTQIQNTKNDMGMIRQLLKNENAHCVTRRNHNSSSNNNNNNNILVCDDWRTRVTESRRPTRPTNGGPRQRHGATFAPVYATSAPAGWTDVAHTDQNDRLIDRRGRRIKTQKEWGRAACCRNITNKVNDRHIVARMQR